MKLWRVGAVALLGAAAALLGACGGGDQVDPFEARRVLAFGDESSVLETDGVKYTVNFVSAADATPPLTRDCTQNPIWVQTLATHYGLTFPQCPGAATTAPASRILAQPGTGVAGLRAQVDAFVAADAFASDDLVTMLTGGADIRALQQQVAAGTLAAEAAALQAEALGSELANQVNRVANLGGKVIVSTAFDPSLSPEGRADATQAATLRTLTRRFNAKLRTGIENDGRKIGLVLFDETLQALVDNTTLNAVDPMCNDATLGDVRTCSTQTLRTLGDGTSASLSTWLWADRRQLSPLSHASLGALAVNRASNNPF